MRSPLPKLAKDLATLVGIARKETSLARIEAALVDAQGQIDAATHDREAAEASYKDGLLDSSEADLAKRLTEKEAATIRLDRAQALHAALMIRLRDAREAEARTARKAIHDEATAKVDAIRARFGAEYEFHASALRRLLADLAEAEIAA